MKRKKHPFMHHYRLWLMAAVLRYGKPANMGFCIGLAGEM